MEVPNLKDMDKGNKFASPSKKEKKKKFSKKRKRKRIYMNERQSEKINLGVFQLVILPI